MTSSPNARIHSHDSSHNHTFQSAHARALQRKRYHTASFSSPIPHDYHFIDDNLPSRLIPRAILIDTEPGTINNIQSCRSGELFSPDNMIYGTSGAGNNWAKGYYSEGKELLDTINDCIHKEIEQCDHIQAIQLIHSLGGGTGSGLGSLILSTLHDEYPNILTSTYSVIPSSKVSDTVIEPYNTVLSMNILTDLVHQVFSFDNEALYHLAMTNMTTVSPSYSDLNRLIANAMSGITSTIRYPSTVNSNYRKLAVNLIPFPRLHFYMISQAPLILGREIMTSSHSLSAPIHHHNPTMTTSSRSSSSSDRYRAFDIMDISHQLFDAKNFMSAVDPRYGKYLTCGGLFRSSDSSSLSLIAIQEALLQLTNRYSHNFTEWIPNHMTVSLSHTPMIPSNTFSATLIVNNTAIQEIWKRILNQYTVMLRRKAFLHWYTAEGMDEMEFMEAEENMKDLITEYQQYQDMTSNDQEEERTMAERCYGEEETETLF